MLELEEKFKENGGEYKEYKLGDLFEVKTSKWLDIWKINFFETKIEDTFEFIWRTQEKYWVQWYVKHQWFDPNDSWVISVSQIGSVHAQLRKNQWYSSQNIFVLTPTDEKLFWNFLISAINKTLSQFWTWYTYYPTLKSLSELIIKLPTTAGEIDFDFMEKYIAELEAQRIAELEAYLVATGLSDYTLTKKEESSLQKFAKLNERERERVILNDNPENLKWKEFEIGELFESFNWNFDIQKEHINWKWTFVVTAGITDKWVLGKTDIDAKIFWKNSTTIDMFGFAFFRTFDYKMVTHARVFSLHSKKWLSQRQNIFLAWTFHYLKKIFWYENMCSWIKIKNKYIKLPTTAGEIDFDFMENFISAIQKLVIKDVVIFTEKKMNAYRQVVQK